MARASRMNDEALKKAKNELYRQKYRDAKMMSQKAMHEESFNSQSSSEDDDDEEDDNENLDGVDVAAHQQPVKKKKKGLMGKVIGGIKNRFY